LGPDKGVVIKHVQDSANRNQDIVIGYFGLTVFAVATAPTATVAAATTRVSPVTRAALATLGGLVSGVV
jgi:hypothetical protein